MRDQDLFTVDSLFRPKRRKMFTQKRKRVCNATWLQKDATLRPKKLDYFLVSNRWRSCVTNSKSCWAPSIHRFGRAFDHSLLQISWKWRVKQTAMAPAKDFKAMTDELWSELNSEIANNLHVHKLAQPDPAFDMSPGKRLERMNTCIQAADRNVCRASRDSLPKTCNLRRNQATIRSPGAKVQHHNRTRWDGHGTATEAMEQKNSRRQLAGLQHMAGWHGNGNGRGRPTW